MGYGIRKVRENLEEEKILVRGSSTFDWFVRPRRRRRFSIRKIFEF
jgi:hypothetical protein